MSSFQSLIENGDCGTTNPVVDLARQFTESTLDTSTLIENHPFMSPASLSSAVQQQPIGSSSSRITNASSNYDMNALLEQMKEMDSLFDKMAMGDEGGVTSEGGDRKLMRGGGDPLLSSGGIEEAVDGSWEEALKSSNFGATSSNSTDFGGVFGGPGFSSSSLVDDNTWEEALLASVGPSLLSPEEAAALPGGNNNWVDEYFRTLEGNSSTELPLEASLDAQEEAAKEADLQAYRNQKVQLDSEGNFDSILSTASSSATPFSSFNFFKSLPTIGTPSGAASTQQPVRAEMTFNLNELVSDQEERLMSMLLSGSGIGDAGGLYQDYATAAATTEAMDPDSMLNLDAIGKKQENTSSSSTVNKQAETFAETSSHFKGLPQSLLGGIPAASVADLQTKTSQDGEKFFYENQFDDMEFWMKLAEDWEHSESGFAAGPGGLEPGLEGLLQTKAIVPAIHEPLEELLKPDHLHHYHFFGENPFLEVEDEEMKTSSEDKPDYLSRGLAKLDVGDIPAAILLFEAAAATEPENARAWHLLGTAQAKNENDRKAIAAMKRCLVLEPENREALLTLAVSFTNESAAPEACAALREWLSASPKYRHLLAEAEAEVEANSAKEKEQPYLGPTPLSKRWGAASSSSQSSGNIFVSGVFERLKGCFISAALMEAEDGEKELPDADVQCALGVLFSLSGDYEKAVDCFRTAVSVHPEDHTLWNRLGATLANGGRSAEAMSAYREALVRYPGYIRARYNLAIACVMLGAESEAVEHLLAVLNLQTAGTRSVLESEGSEGLKPSMLAEIIANPSAITSTNVWNMLRTVFLSLGREDLFPAISGRQLELLNREFGFEVHQEVSAEVEA